MGYGFEGSVHIKYKSFKGSMSYEKMTKDSEYFTQKHVNVSFQVAYTYSF